MKLVNVKHPPHKAFFVMKPSVEGWSTEAKEPPSPHEKRLAPLDTNAVFQYLGVKK